MMLSAQEVLEAWDECAALPPSRRAVALAARANPQPGERAETLTLGSRDRLLLDLRARLFGRAMTALANCPSCQTVVESQFATGALCAEEPGDAEVEREIAVAGSSVRFRLPNSMDIAAVEGMRDAADVRARLLDRCILTEGAVSEEARDAVAGAMGDADPQADIQLALDCPACGNRWMAPFDIGSFLWTELNAWARKMLHEVHVLASAYGWTEAEILSLTPLRRRLYMEMAAHE
jgi:hypothetical protein